ncbi:MAG: hypothetical protein ACOYLB_02200 [Phototrophicaceae bacterium]
MNQEQDAICQTKRRLADAVGSLVECSEVNDIQTYTANSTFLIVSVTNSNLPTDLKRSIIQLVDLHDLLLMTLNLIALKRNWNRNLARKLRDWGVRMAEVTTYLNTEGNITIRSSVDEVLPSAEVKKSYRAAALYANTLKWIPAEVLVELLKLGLPVAFSITVDMINAHEYFEPIESNLHIVEQDELCREAQAHLLQIQAELRDVLVC